MKTLFYSLMTFAFVLSGFGAKASTLTQKEEVGPKITISIELGKKSKGCLKIGICRISFEGIERQSGPVNENKAVATAWISNGKLQIEFDRSSMTDATYQTHFGSGQFQLEEDFVLPAEVAFALGVRSYTVKTGRYPLPQSTSESTMIPVIF